MVANASYAEIQAQARNALAIRAAVAREDPQEFMELVLRDETTGALVEQSPAHAQWQELITQHDRLVLWSHVESGKTNQITIGRVLYEIGRNPNIRCAIVSNTQDQAKKPLSTIKQYIEGTAQGSHYLRQVFPHLQKGSPWQANRLTVQRPRTLKDPTVQALGVHGNILGARLDLVILDDVLDYENTLTARAREDLWGWFHSTLLGRLTPHAKVVLVGTAHHPEDLMHRLSAAESVWAGRKFPVADPVTGKVNWPRQWPPERVARKRRELGDLEYSRQMLCEPRDDSTARFKRAWIEGCQELGRKRGIKLYRTLDDIPDAIWDRAVERAEEQLGGVPGGRVYTGVDLGVSQRAGSDLTVLFTILVHADATRQVLGIESGRWTAPEIIRRIVDTHNRYDSKVIVENVSAQDFLRQFATAYTHVPIVPFTTTARKKWHPRFGVESIATELENGKWWIPDDPEHKALRAWIREMLYYDPNGHTGDHLMAAWFAREGARRDERGSGKPRGVTARVL